MTELSIRPAQGTCCPEPSCDHRKKCRGSTPYIERCEACDKECKECVWGK